MNDVAALRLGLIGFGEVGQVIANDLCQSLRLPIKVWDRLFATADSVPSLAVRRMPNVQATTCIAQALEGTTLVISAVTASECVAVARESAPSLEAGCFFLDLNSVSPRTKQSAAELVAGRARYVEAAVMSPFGVHRLLSPILLGGPHAEDFLPFAQAAGLGGARVYSNDLGAASAAKMCRSVMIKGLEALLAESLVSARHYGVEGAVIDSLRDLLPGTDWHALSCYMLSRSILHGKRRAEEMREAARTVSDAGVQAWMSTACAERQAWAALQGRGADCSSLPKVLEALGAHTDAAASADSPAYVGSRVQRA